jgi:ribonuclease HII
MSRAGKAGQKSLFPGDKNSNLLGHDEIFRRRGFRLLAGVDEAGRGPLAGPVVAAAVILPRDATLEGLADSKRLSPTERDRLLDLIGQAAVAIGVGIVDAEEIDRINILRASLQAMEKAVAELDPPPEVLLIDGPFGIGNQIPQFPLVRGDSRSESVAAASIVAKVTRDRMMARYHELFPQYGFISHKGYATRAHVTALREHGCSPIHRKTFRPVRNVLEDRAQPTSFAGN